MSLIAIKTIISVLVILGLIFISERNPKLGGLLIVLPIGTGIIVFFYGIEKGVYFVIQGVPYGIAGLVSSLYFAVDFFLGGKLFTQRKIVNIISSILTGLSLFFIVGYCISIFELSLIKSIIILLTGIIPAILLLSKIPDNKKNEPKKLQYYQQ